MEGGYHVSNFSKYRSRCLALAAALVVLLSACTTDNGIEDASATTSETVVTTASTTTSSSTTAQPTTTETTEPTSTTLDDETAIRQLHTYFMTEVFARDERSFDPDAWLTEVEQLSTGRLEARILQNTAKRQDEGRYIVSPGYDSNIVEVRINGESASVLDCGMGLARLIDANGTVLVPEDDFFKFREAIYEVEDGHWVIEEIATGGDTRCEP